jgi:hypothetical protein
MIDLDEAWQYYAKLQEDISKTTKLGPRASALEEKLNVFLSDIENNNLPTDPISRDKKFINLEINRQKKYRHRENLLSIWATEFLGQEFEDNTISRIILGEEMAEVKGLTSCEEWRILWALANDHSYDEIAEKEEISLAAIKTRVSRSRKRLRESLANKN